MKLYASWIMTHNFSSRHKSKSSCKLYYLLNSRIVAVPGSCASLLLTIVTIAKSIDSMLTTPAIIWPIKMYWIKFDDKTARNSPGRVQSVTTSFPLSPIDFTDTFWTVTVYWIGSSSDHRQFRDFTKKSAKTVEFISDTQ